VALEATLQAALRLTSGFNSFAGAVAENLEIQAMNVAAATPETLLGALQKYVNLIDTLTSIHSKVMTMQRLLVPPAPETRAPSLVLEASPDSTLERLGRVVGLMGAHGLLPMPAADPIVPSASYQGEESDTKIHDALILVPDDLPVDP
jgi:hypothetical protein